MPIHSYNPHKPGRPSHVYHTYMIGELRLALAVEVHPGRNHAAPGLWTLLACLGRERWPALLRGDIAWVSEAHMSRAEGEGLPYLFKLRTMRNVKRLLERAMAEGGWQAAGQGFEGQEATLRLAGWSRGRRVVLLRRRLARELAVAERDNDQLRLSLGRAPALRSRGAGDLARRRDPDPRPALSRPRRLRERVRRLKNHWGWGGFTPQDLKRCR